MTDKRTSPDVASNEISEHLRTAGVAGAGGAGFVSHVKWTDLDSISSLLVNHQESEPSCYSDVWLGKEFTERFDQLFDYLLQSGIESIVIGTKAKYRERWTNSIQKKMESTVVQPSELPFDVSQESGVVLAYTPDVYTYSEESVLLMVTTGTQIGDDLPTGHGWIVHNTETLFNIGQALFDEEPVTRKYVHVDGDTPVHRCLEVPIGTPADELLEAAGISDMDELDGKVLADGGPGWCYEIDQTPAEFGVRKRTNCILVLDEQLASEHKEDDGQIDVLSAQNWEESDERPHEKDPTLLSPSQVRIPLITNEAYEGLISPSVPTIDEGDVVTAGDVIAEPDAEGYSNTQHASIDGIVTEIADKQITIDAR